eukprot:SAG22_NODE_689_length_7904_cov_3.365279_6_plen_535_part_00
MSSPIGGAAPAGSAVGGGFLDGGRRGNAGQPCPFASPGAYLLQARPRALQQARARFQNLQPSQHLAAVDGDAATVSREVQVELLVRNRSGGGGGGVGGVGGVGVGGGVGGGGVGGGGGGGEGGGGSTPAAQAPVAAASGGFVPSVLGAQLAPFKCKPCGKTQFEPSEVRQLLGCGHQVCLPCLRTQAVEAVANLAGDDAAEASAAASPYPPCPVPGCKNKPDLARGNLGWLVPAVAKTLLPPADYDGWLEACLQQFTQQEQAAGTLVRCPQCMLCFTAHQVRTKALPLLPVVLPLVFDLRQWLFVRSVCPRSPGSCRKPLKTPRVLTAASTPAALQSGPSLPRCWKSCTLAWDSHTHPSPLTILFLVAAWTADKPQNARRSTGPNLGETIEVLAEVEPDPDRKGRKGEAPSYFKLAPGPGGAGRFVATTLPGEGAFFERVASGAPTAAGGAAAAGGKAGAAEPEPEAEAAEPEAEGDEPAAEAAEVADAPRPVFDALGVKRPLTEVEWAHYESHRFRCPECTTNFCRCGPPSSL